jgi:hypothetical protein
MLIAAGTSGGTTDWEGGSMIDGRIKFTNVSRAHAPNTDQASQAADLELMLDDPAGVATARLGQAAWSRLLRPTALEPGWRRGHVS